MKIVVVGCGKIGKSIIASLVEEKHELIAIDLNPDVVTQVANEYDVMCICGNGTGYDKLLDAGTDKADLFIAVTNLDELNMLSCFAAKRMGAKHTVARIRNTQNNTNRSLEFLKGQLELDMSINPEMLTAKALCDILKLPSALKVETFSSRRLELLELSLKADSNLDGMSIIDLRKDIRTRFLICTVSRDGKIYIPKGNFILRKGDKIGVIVPEENTDKILRVLGAEQKTIKNAIILGGGMTSLYLADLLVKNRIDVKIVERDKKKCEELCAALPDKVSVICGDGMSQELLAEEGIADTDAFVSLTGMDEQNILISFYALARNVSKVIAKVNCEELSSLAEKLGLDCLVSPKDISADIIVRYARGLRNSLGSKVETLYSLLNGEAEALEFKVMPDFSFVNAPLKTLHFRENVLLAGIIRGKDAIIPNGDDVIRPNDKVIVIAAGQRLYDLGDIIEG